MNYYADFLTRQVLVQFAYNYLMSGESDFLQNIENFDIPLKFNNELFEQIVKNLKTDIDDLREIENFCSKAIIIVGISELRLQNRPKNVVINEYVKIAKLFAFNDFGLINKILDKFAREELLTSEAADRLCK
jgi:transcription termination factor NusB